MKRGNTKRRQGQGLDLIQGTLDMLVLQALRWGPRHGYELMHWIRTTSAEELKLEEGALYPALHRIHAKAWIEAEWGVSENNRRAKFYSLTIAGRTELARATASWNRYVGAVSRVIEARV